MTLLIAPVAGVLCFFVIWIAFRLRWSRLIVTMMCAVIIGASMAAYFADPVIGQAACPLAGLVLGSVLGAGIGWTTHGAVSEAIRQRQTTMNSTPSSAASGADNEHE